MILIFIASQNLHIVESLDDSEDKHSDGNQTGPIPYNLDDGGMYNLFI